MHINNCVPTYFSPSEINTDILLPIEDQLLSYWILERNSPFSIRIDNTTQRPYLQLLETLDYETDMHDYVLTVVASDGSFETPTNARLRIYLTNEDDSEPEFSERSYQWQLFENSEQFSAEVLVTDPDNLGSISHSILQPDDSQIVFEIDEHNGTILSFGPFDFEQYPHGINFTVLASDEAGHVATADATLYLLDVNDHPPTFLQESYQFSVREDTKVGQLAFSLLAVDLDGTARHSMITRYFIHGLNQTQLRQLPFELQENGTVYLTRELDYETLTREYSFHVVALDNGNLTSLPVLVQVSIADVADTAPCPTQLEYNVMVTENQIPNVPVIVFEIDLIEYNSSLLTFNLHPERNEFQVRSDGGLYLVRALDYENEPKIEFNLTVSDDTLTCQTPSLIVVTVRNDNDYPPEFTQTSYTASVSENTPLTDLLYMETTDDDGEPFATVVLYEISPPSIPFRVTGGFLQNTAPLDAETNTTYTFEVVAIDLSLIHI